MYVDIVLGIRVVQVMLAIIYVITRYILFFRRVTLIATMDSLGKRNCIWLPGNYDGVTLAWIECHLPVLLPYVRRLLRSARRLSTAIEETAGRDDGRNYDCACGACRSTT